MNYIWPSNFWTPNSQFSKFSCFATQLCPKLHLHAARAIKNIVHRILAVGNDRNPYALDMDMAGVIPKTTSTPLTGQTVGCIECGGLCVQAFCKHLSANTFHILQATTTTP